MGLSAITLVTDDMARSVAFWSVPGPPITFGGPEARFTSLRFGDSYVNLVAVDGADQGFWGRCIIHVDDPDALHRAYREAGYSPLTEPADAPWGERYFHIVDPAGHEISFATPLVDPADAGPGHGQPDAGNEPETGREGNR